MSQRAKISSSVLELFKMTLIKRSNTCFKPAFWRLSRDIPNTVRCSIAGSCSELSSASALPASPSSSLFAATGGANLFAWATCSAAPLSDVFSIHTDDAMIYVVTSAFALSASSNLTDSITLLVSPIIVSNVDLKTCVSGSRNSSP